MDYESSLKRIDVMGRSLYSASIGFPRGMAHEHPCCEAFLLLRLLQRITTSPSGGVPNLMASPYKGYNSSILQRFSTVDINNYKIYEFNPFDSPRRSQNSDHYDISRGSDKVDGSEITGDTDSNSKSSATGGRPDNVQQSTQQGPHFLNCDGK